MISLMLMSEAINIKNTFSQFIVLTRSSYNLINSSLKDRPKGEESPLFMLFYQTWFVQLLNSTSTPSEFRELIVTALTQSAICLKNYNNSPLDKWLQIAFEVVDVCFKVLDWDTSDLNNPKLPPRYTASLSYVLFIEEITEIAFASNNPESIKHVRAYITEIAKRFLNTVWELSSIKNELTKIYSILLVSKYWVPDDLDSGNDQKSSSILQLFVFFWVCTKIKNLIKLKLFSYEMKEGSEFDVFFDNKPELLLYALYYFASRFPAIKIQVQELLNQLEELLSEVTNRGLPPKISRKFEAFKELLSIIISAIFEYYHTVFFDFNK